MDLRKILIVKQNTDREIKIYASLPSFSFMASILKSRSVFSRQQIPSGRATKMHFLNAVYIHLDLIIDTRSLVAGRRRAPSSRRVVGSHVGDGTYMGLSRGGVPARLQKIGPYIVSLANSY